MSDRGFVRRSRRIGCWAVREFTPRNNLAAEFGHAMKKVTSEAGLRYEAISFRQIEKLHQNMYVQSHSEKVIFAILVTVFSELFIGPRNPTAATQSQPRTQTTFRVTNRIGCSHRPPRLKTPHARATDLKRQSASAHTRRSPTADFQPPRLESIESTRHGRTMASMTASLCAPNRVCPSLGGQRALGSTRALAAARAPARSNSRRSVTTRAVQEIAGADWKKEVLEVRPVTTPPYPRLAPTGDDSSPTEMQTRARRSEDTIALNQTPNVDLTHRFPIPA